MSSNNMINYCLHILLRFAVESALKVDGGKVALLQTPVLLHVLHGREHFPNLAKPGLDIGIGDFGEGATIINRSARLFNKPEDLNAYFAYSSNLPKYRELLFSTLALSSGV